MRNNVNFYVHIIEINSYLHSKYKKTNMQNKQLYGELNKDLRKMKFYDFTKIIKYCIQ